MNARHVLRTSLALGLLLVMSACGGTGPRDPIQSWLLCDDCSGELTNVVALDDAAIDPLIVALRQGPSASSRDNYRAQVIEEYRMARRGAGVGVASIPDSTSYVNTAVGNLVASYQKRAAVAVRTIAATSTSTSTQTRARQELHKANLDAGTLNWRADVLETVQQLDSDTPIIGVTVRSPVAKVPVGGQTVLTATVLGVGTVPQQVTWSSSNVAIATVTAAGEFTRLAAGTVAAIACSTAQPQICGSLGIGMP